MTKIDSLIIRNAKASDFKYAAPLIIQAMEDLARFFIQSEDINLAIPLFEYFFQQENNQYSYQNTLIFEINDQVAGTITAYDGKYLNKFRTPFLSYLESHYQLKNFLPEDEAEADEYYIDTLSVSPAFQGKGIGSKLIQAIITKAKKLGHNKIGLLVDLNNPNAKKLYTKLGFKSQGIKNFIGGQYEHMQIIF